MNGEKRKLPKPSCLGTYPSWSGTREEKLWSCCVHIFGLMPPKQKRGCAVGRRTHAFTSHLILFVLVYKQTSSQTICEVLLPVYVIAPVLGTTVGTDSWNPGLKAVCSQSCRVALGPRVEIKYLSKSACGAQKGAEWRIWTFWGWQRTEAGECRWWCMTVALCFQNLGLFLYTCATLRKLLKKVWQDKCAGVHHQIYYYIAPAYFLEIDSQSLWMNSNNL